MPRRAAPVMLAVVLLASSASSQVPLGSEFQVNTFTTGPQTYPSVSADALGSFVVVWDDFGQTNFAADVFARRYDASGTPAGAEFVVNSFTTGLQAFAKVASQPGGGFVVVWTSIQPVIGADVFGRRFDAAGTAIGLQFQINTYTTGTQARPSVASDSAGNFVVAWRSQQGVSGYETFAQRFSTSGVPQGAEFQVNSYTTGSQLPSRVAVDPVGNFVVAWISEDGDDFGVFGQRYDATGAAAGGEFQVNTYTTGAQSAGQVAHDAGGNFFVAWTSDGEDGDAFGVFGRRYDAAGVPRGSEFRVNSETLAAQQNAAVTSDASGNFVVVWESYGQDGSLNGVFGQRFDALGAAGAEFRVNSYATGHQNIPSVASDGDGNLVTVWQSDGQDGSARGIFGQRFLSDLIFKDGFEL